MRLKRKGNRRSLKTGKKKINLSLFTDDMLVYVENPKETTKTLETSDYRTAAGHKVNIHKPMAFC